MLPEQYVLGEEVHIFEQKDAEDRKMIELQTVQAKDRDLLWNINQKYLYEMTLYYDDPMDENGNYHYGHFDDYFLDPNPALQSCSLPSLTVLSVYQPHGLRPDILCSLRQGSFLSATNFVHPFTSASERTSKPFFFQKCVDCGFPLSIASRTDVFPVLSK